MKLPTSRRLHPMWAICATVAMVFGAATATTTPASAADDATFVYLDEDFSDGVVPEGWTAESGTWDVVDGRLRGSVETAATVRMKLPTPSIPFTDYKYEAAIRFDSVLNSARFIHMIAEGNAVAVRSQTTATNGLEYYGATRSKIYAGPFDVGVGTDFNSVIEVHGSHMTWSLNGTEVLNIDDYAAREARWGLNVNGATVLFDDIKITDLNPQATAPTAPAFPLLAEGEHDATISWSAPEFAGSHIDRTLATITSYEVSAAGASTPVEQAAWEPATGTSHTFTNLPAGEQQILRVRAINSAGLAGPAAHVRTISGADVVDGYLRSFDVTTAAGGHVQGIAVDTESDLVYLSFIDRIVKADKAGNILGSVKGLTGHLGDITVNPVDGKIYGAYYWSHAGSGVTQFATAIIDPDLITTIDMPAEHNPAFSLVPVKALDALSFGPAFGTTTGEALLTVALNHPENMEYQYFAQYDVSDFEALATEYDATVELAASTLAPVDTYSVYTGTVSYNVPQNLAYDPSLQRWFFSVYAGTDAQFPNYTMFAVDAASVPTMQTFVGTDQQGLVIALAADGLQDAPTGIRGWYQKADNGIQPLDDGLYYLSSSVAAGNQKQTTFTLYTWSNDANAPFGAPAATTPVDGINVEVTVASQAAGTLVLTVAEHGDAVVLAEGQAADRLKFTGELPEITVSDSRNATLAGNGGWGVTGQSSTFASGSDVFDAGHLAWAPVVVAPRDGVTAGSAVLTSIDGGQGLAASATLATADTTGRNGSTALSAALSLELPTDTASGTYRGTITLSLFPVD